MSRRGPAQQPYEGTYYSNTQLQWVAQNRLVPSYNSDETAGFWTTMMGHTFPSTENYMVYPEKAMGSGNADVTVTKIILASGRNEQFKFFVIECKPPGDESQTGVWKEGYDQLFAYLCSTRRFAGRRQFGVVAVGKYCRFYEFDSLEKTLEPIHEGHLRVDRECQTVQEYLNLIKREA